jgi:raffinose/stachyose/melibiose transport system permease protein/N-acetylglucosamine transport system permease protein
MRWTRAGVRAAIQVLMIFVTFLSIAPILIIWFSSLKTSPELSTSPLALPHRWLFSNFADAWRQAHMGQYAVNSVLVTVPTLMLVLGTASLAGYAFAVLVFPGRSVLFTIFLFGLMVPSISVVVALFYTVHDLGLLNTRTGLVLAETAQALPLAIFLMRSAFRDLPRELREAALVDGAREFAVFLRVMVPLARPALAAAAVLAFLQVWNDYLLPLVLTSSDTLRTLPLGVAFLEGQYTYNIVLIAAGTSLASVPSVLIYAILHQQFAQGIVAGSLK